MYMAHAALMVGSSDRPSGHSLPSIEYVEVLLNTFGFFIQDGIKGEVLVPELIT